LAEPQKDIVAAPLAHDTPDEVTQPHIKDWYKGETEAIPGKTMHKLAVVDRDYTKIYEKFITLGNNICKTGLSAHGNQFACDDVYQEMIESNHFPVREMDGEIYPSIEEDVDAEGLGDGEELIDEDGELEGELLIDEDGEGEDEGELLIDEDGELEGELLIDDEGEFEGDDDIDDEGDETGAAAVISIATLSYPTDPCVHVIVCAPAVAFIISEEAPYCAADVFFSPRQRKSLWQTAHLDRRSAVAPGLPFHRPRVLAPG